MLETMEDIHLKELKSFSVSEMMNFREKYNELINNSTMEESEEIKVNESDPDLYLSTGEKIEKKSAGMVMKVNRKRTKNDRRDLPALLPLYVPQNMSSYENPENDLQPGRDVVFMFRIYPPFTYDPQVRCAKMRHEMEIAMLGYQTLNLLCDKIICREGYMEVGGDISETPDIPARLRLGEKYKSRMLYIGNTFYVDKSHPNNVDYSETIRSWGNSNNIEFGETLDMFQHTCLDLVARIGYPYVYQHLGGCEHIIRIEYARLVEPKDCLESKFYPFYHYLARNNAKVCMACMEISQWVIYDSNRMISNPSFLCDSCFRSYHYIDGKKVGTFSAVRYWDYPVFSTVFDTVCDEDDTKTEVET